MRHDAIFPSLFWRYHLIATLIPSKKGDGFVFDPNKFKTLKVGPTAAMSDVMAGQIFAQ